MPTRISGGYLSLAGGEMQGQIEWDEALASGLVELKGADDQDFNIEATSGNDLDLGVNGTTVIAIAVDSVTTTPASLTSGGTDDYGLSIAQTLNDSGAAGGSDLYNAFKVNITETDITGWDTVNLMDLQVGGTSMFTVSNTGGLTVSAIQLNDDEPLRLGTSQDATLQWETADANANALILALPAGDATNVPVFAVGDDTALGADLGLFDGVTEPLVAAISPDATAYTSMYHDNTDGVIEPSAGNLRVVTAHLQVDETQRVVFDADEDTYLRASADDTLVVTAGGADILQFVNAGTIFPDNKLAIFGTGQDASVYYNTNQTPDALFIGVGQDSRGVIIAEGTDRLTDFGHAIETNPTLFIHSSDATDTTQWVSIAHNQTDAVVAAGTGDITFANDVRVGSTTDEGLLKVFEPQGAISGIIGYASNGNSIACWQPYSNGSNQSFAINAINRAYNGSSWALLDDTGVGMAELITEAVGYQIVTFTASSTSPVSVMDLGHDGVMSIYSVSSGDALDLEHNGTKAIISTDAGDLELAPAGGDVFVGDDVAFTVGDTRDAHILWETADANAHAMVFALPDGGATNVPVVVIGDKGAPSVVNADLGLFDGITDPTLAILDDDNDSALELYHDGTNAVVSSSAGDIVLSPAGGQVTLTDDNALGLGSSNDAQLLWETADANANCMLISLPAGDATNVPVVAIGDDTALNLDLGLFDGFTEPTLAVLSPAATKATYVYHDETNGSIETTSGGLLLIPASGQVLNQNGTNAAPSFSFENDPDTGMYSNGTANNISFATNGSSRISIGTGAIQFNLDIRNIDGDASSPSITFTNDTDTGMYRIGDNNLGIAAGSGLQLQIDGNESAFKAGMKVNRTAQGAGNYTALVTDYIIAKTGITASGDTITLPAAATAGAGKVFVIKDESGNATPTDFIRVDGNGAETIDGLTTQDIDSAYGSLTIYCDGSNWFII